MEIIKYFYTLKMTKRRLNNEKGFTLIELAIVMVIIGILAGGGVSLMGMLSERKSRNETAEYLDNAKNSLINFAKIHGRLPWADSDGDGDEDTGASVGTFPYLDLSFRPSDSNKRVLRYELNSNLGSGLPGSCNCLRGGLSGSRPVVIDSDGSPTEFSVALVLISAGQADADGDGNVFDDITAGAFQGDNRDGTPRYIRHPPSNTFDDLVVYISGYELYGEICGDPVFTVNNTTGSNVYVYDNTQSTDIGIVSPGSVVSFRIISGDRITLLPSANGIGSPVNSDPMTPLIIAGSGRVVSIP